MANVRIGSKQIPQHQLHTSTNLAIKSGRPCFVSLSRRLRASWQHVQGDKAVNLYNDVFSISQYSFGICLQATSTKIKSCSEKSNTQLFHGFTSSQCFYASSQNHDPIFALCMPRLQPSSPSPPRCKCVRSMASPCVRGHSIILPCLQGWK